MSLFKRLWHEESGASASEYGILIGVLAAVVLTGALLLRDRLDALFFKAGATLEEAID